MQVNQQEMQTMSKQASISLSSIICGISPICLARARINKGVLGCPEGDIIHLFISLEFGNNCFNYYSFRPH